MPSYEFAYSRVSSSIDKVGGLIRDGDKMSALGWELKGIYDDVTAVLMFWQREIVTTPTPTTTTTAPAAVTSSVETTPLTTQLVRQIQPARLPGQSTVVVLRK